MAPLRTTVDRDALARHGIEPTAGGYALAALEAAIAAHGWSHRIEERAPGSPRAGRYQALVFVREEGGANPRHPSMRSARGRGATEEAALATALARMLASGRGGTLP